LKWEAEGFVAICILTGFACADNWNQLRAVQCGDYNGSGHSTLGKSPYMSVDVNQELLNFHQFLAEQLRLGVPYSSPEEAVEAWRLRNRSPEEIAEDVQAIREALADMEAGDTGRPFEQFDREFRKRNNLE
jgi:hypothetical protein